MIRASSFPGRGFKTPEKVFFVVSYEHTHNKRTVATVAVSNKHSFVPISMMCCNVDREHYQNRRYLLSIPDNDRIVSSRRSCQICGEYIFFKIQRVYGTPEEKTIVKNITLIRMIRED